MVALSPTPTSSTAPAGTVLGAQWLLGLILVFAPLFRSGQPALAVLVLELLAVLLLVLVLWRPGQVRISRVEGAALVLLIGLPMLYLMPLPAGLAGGLPGRGLYEDAAALFAADAPGGLARPSLVPAQTEAALLFLVVPLAVFLGTRMLDSGRAMVLVRLLLGIAALQGLVGLLQYGAGKGSPELLGISLSEARVALGTYTNRNHLAGLLNMVLPMVLGLMVATIGHGRHAYRSDWRGRLAFFASAGGHAALVYGAVALLLLVAVTFTRSRAGITLAILGVVLSTLAFARRIGGDNVYGPTGTVVALALGAGVAIGLIPVLDRFSLEDAIADARWEIFSATLTGIGSFFPLGSGPGNFPTVFPAFQPPELGRWWINHAHNDFLQWLFEGGVLAAAVIFLLLALYARQWVRVWSAGAWARSRFVQVGAGIGVLLVLLHSLVDFNLHIPANIVYFAFLAGLFFADPTGEANSQRRRRRTRDLGDDDERRPDASGSRKAAPGVQIPNPFLD